MKRRLIMLTALVTLVPRIDAPATQTDYSQAVQQERETDFVGKSRRGRANSGTLEDRIRFFAERGLRLDEREVEKFVTLAHIVADFLGVDLSEGDSGYAGGFVLILVLFILLVIIGAGFGGG